MSDTYTVDTTRPVETIDVTDADAPYGRNVDGVPLDRNGDPAPYGLKKDGTAAKRRGRQPGSTVKVPGKAKAKRSSAKGATDYRPGVLGITQIPVAMLAGVGVASNNDTLLADAQIIGMSAPSIADALNDLAQENSQIAGALDRLLKVGPYTALTMAVLPMVVQIGVNHGVIPSGVGSKMGAVYDPADLAAAARTDVDKLVSENGNEG